MDPYFSGWCCTGNEFDLLLAKVHLFILKIGLVHFELTEFVLYSYDGVYYLYLRKARDYCLLV